MADPLVQPACLHLTAHSPLVLSRAVSSRAGRFMRTPLFQSGPFSVYFHEKDGRHYVYKHGEVFMDFPPGPDGKRLAVEAARVNAEAKTPGSPTRVDPGAKGSKDPRQGA